MASDPDYCGCGDSKLWAKDQSHWAHGCCVMHDAAYVMRRKNKLNSRITRKMVDDAFDDCMRRSLARLGGGSFKQHVERWLFHKIARIAGVRYWRPDEPK